MMRFHGSTYIFFTVVLTYCFYETSCQDELNKDCPLQKQPKLIKINKENYILSHLKTYVGTAPNQVRYFDGEIMYKLDKIIFTYQENSIADKVIGYKLLMEKRNKYVDNNGNVVTNKNKTTFMFDYNSYRKLKIITNIGIQTDYLCVDMDKNRIYLVGYDVKGQADCGSLFVFEMNDYNVAGGIIKLQAVEGIENIVSIAIDNLSGNLVIAVKNDEYRWSLYVMANVNTDSCKVPPQQGIYKSALRSAVKLAGEELIRLYEEAITGNEESEIIKRQKYIQFPSGGNTMPMIDGEIASSSTPTPAYSATAASDFNSCGNLFIEMTAEIEKLRSETDSMRANYNVWYDKIFLSDVLKNLVEFEKKFYLSPFNATNFGTEKMVCYDENNNQNIVKSLTEAKLIMKKTIDWFIFVKESIDNEDLKKIFQLDMRFSNEAAE